ncbi:uncharacterized LOC118070556 [Chelonus insularis]|uniref:uncharacterized LOC118070556 n=1 Tax=Chelonus insularis TaxID=460826 RepID=UPI00158BFFA7|nr:uncharacterized LOC118070556 [Chelonus insularis]KAG8148333.1 ToNVorf29-like protein [Chelonus insularis]
MVSSSIISSEAAKKIENLGSQPPKTVFGFPCFYHNHVDQLLNKDIVIKCEFKADNDGLLYHVIYFKTISSAKLITHLTSCRYILGYDGNVVTLYELISAFLISPISRLSIDTQFVYLCDLFNDIFHYIYELTERNLINHYLIGSEYHVKFFCDNIAFINSKNRLSFILRCTLTAVDAIKARTKFMKQYASILEIAKYILFSTKSKIRSMKNVSAYGIRKNESRKIYHDGICKLKNCSVRINVIDDSLFHSVFCMQVSAKYPVAYKLLRLADIFNIPLEPTSYMIHHIFE